MADRGLTGGFGNLFGNENDLLLELAMSRVPMDPNEPLDVWEKKVRKVFWELKDSLES